MPDLYIRLLMTAPTKRIMIGLAGQSNMTGKRQPAGAGDTFASGLYGAPDICTYGSPVSDPILPEGPKVSPTNGYYGSMWPNVSERLGRERSIWASVKNTAVRGTAIVNDWVGIVGGVVQSSGDGGYDPNGYIDQLVTSINVGAFDETWVLTMFGITDAGDGVTSDQFRDAHISLADHMLSLGFKVALGLTTLSSSHGNHTAFVANCIPGLAAAISNYSAEPDVYTGVNAYSYYSGDMTIPDELADTTHWSLSVYDYISDQWFGMLDSNIS